MASRRMTATPRQTACTLSEFKHQGLISISKPLGAISLAIGSTATFRSLFHGALLEALSVPIYPLLLALPAITVLVKQTKHTAAACYCSHILRSWALLAVGLKLAPNAEAIHTILHIRIELILEALLCFQDQLSPWIMVILHALRQLGWMSIIYTNMQYSLQHAIVRGIINWTFLTGMSCFFEYRTRKQYSRYIYMVENAQAAADRAAVNTPHCKQDDSHTVGSPANKHLPEDGCQSVVPQPKVCTTVQTLSSKPQQKLMLQGGFLDSNDADVYDEWFSDEELEPLVIPRQPSSADKHDGHEASMEQTSQGPQRPTHHNKLLDSFCPQQPHSAIIPQTGYDPTAALTQQANALAFFSLTNQTDWLESTRMATFPFDISGSASMRCDRYSADGSLLASTAIHHASRQGSTSKILSMPLLNESQEPASVLDVGQSPQCVWSNVPAVKCRPDCDNHQSEHIVQTVDSSGGPPANQLNTSRPAVDAGPQPDALGDVRKTSLSGRPQPSISKVLKFMEAAKQAPYVSRHQRSTVCIKMKGIEPHQLPPQLIADLQDQLSSWNPSMQVHGSAVRAGCVIVTLDLLQLSHISRPRKGTMEAMLATILSSALSHTNLPEGTPATIQVGSQVSTMWWDNVDKQYVFQAVEEAMVPYAVSLPGSRMGLHLDMIDGPLSELMLNSNHHDSSPINITRQQTCDANTSAVGISALQQRCCILSMSQAVHVLDANAKPSKRFSFTVLLMLPTECTLSGWSCGDQKQAYGEAGIRQLNAQVDEETSVSEVFILARGLDAFNSVSVIETAERRPSSAQGAALAQAEVTIEIPSELVAPMGITLELWCRSFSSMKLNQSFASLYTTAQDMPFGSPPSHSFLTDSPRLATSDHKRIKTPRHAFEFMHDQTSLLILSDSNYQAAEELAAYIYQNADAADSSTTLDGLRSQTLKGGNGIQAFTKPGLCNTTSSNDAQLGISKMDMNDVGLADAAQLGLQSTSSLKQFLSDLGHWFNYSSLLQRKVANKSPMDETIRGVGYDVLSHCVQQGLCALSELIVCQLERLDRSCAESNGPTASSREHANPWLMDVSLLSRHSTVVGGSNNGPDMTPTESTWTQGNSLLHLAMLSSRPDMLSSVLRWGQLYGGSNWCWDWNLVNMSGLTPLHVAASLGVACEFMLEAIATAVSSEQLERISHIWFNSSAGVGCTPSEIRSSTGIKIHGDPFSSATKHKPHVNSSTLTNSLSCRIMNMRKLFRQLMSSPPGYTTWLHEQLRPVTIVWRCLMLLMLASLLFRASQEGHIHSDFPAVILCLGGYLPALLAVTGKSARIAKWQVWTLPLMLCRAAAVLLPSLGILPFPHSWASGLSLRTDLFFELLQTIAEQMPLPELLAGRAAMTVACWRAYMFISKPRPFVASLALNLACIPVAVLCHVWQVQVYLLKRQLGSSQTGSAQGNNLSGTSANQTPDMTDTLKANIRHVAEGEHSKAASGNVLRQRTIIKNVLVSHHE